MATRRILTRNQAKKMVGLQAREELSPSKRKPSTQAMEVIDVENDLLGNTSTCSLNKSYPQDSDPRKVDKRKIVKTENSGKQRRTLSERGTNALRQTDRPTTKGGHVTEVKSTRTESPILIDTPREETEEVEDSIQEEVIELDSQTASEELMALPPMVKGYYNGEMLSAYKTSSHDDTLMILDGDPWRERTESTERRESRSEPFPSSIEDIDRNADTLHTSVYSQDIMEYLREKELLYPLGPNFLEINPEITPKMRGVLMNWLIQVQDHENIEQETLHLCVSLIDRYMAQSKVRMPRLQLVGITCFLIATKFLERFAPEITTLCYLTAQSCKPSHVIRYEKLILMTLDFELCAPVSVTFLERYLQVHEDTQPREVSLLAHYLLDLSVTSMRLATTLPSTLAASALYLARRLTLGSSQAWTPSLAYYTAYNSPNDLLDPVSELAHLLFKAPSSKFQGAREKHKDEKYGCISYSPLTSPQAVECHFTMQVSSV